MIKGLRSVPTRVVSIGAAGRSLDQQIEHIRKEGTLYTLSLLGTSIISGLEIRSKRGSGENVIVIGCAC